jgi:hypothetical protein
MESQRVMTRGFNMSLHPRKCYTVRPADAIQRVRQSVCAKVTVIMLLLTAKKPIVMDALRKEMTFNQLHFVDCIFPDLKRQT